MRVLMILPVIALCARSLIAEELFIPSGPPQERVVVGHYRGRPIALDPPVGADAPLPLMTNSAREFSVRDREEWKLSLQHKRFIAALRSVIVAFWFQRLGVQSDQASLIVEKHEALRELVGKRTFTTEDTQHIDLPGGLDALPMPGFVELLRLHVKNPTEAESAYRRVYHAELTREDWERCKGLYGTPEALKSYTSRVYVQFINELAESRAKRRVREAALAKALVATNRIKAETDFNIWLQSELKEVELRRADFLALLIRETPLSAPILDPLYCEGGPERSAPHPPPVAEEPRRPDDGGGGVHDGVVAVQRPAATVQGGTAIPSVLVTGAVSLLLGLCLGIIVARRRQGASPSGTRS